MNQQAFGPSFNIQQMDLGLPSVVNAALALELYFKTLYFLEKGEDFKVNGRFSHDFYLLFGQLGSSTRQRMESAFAESIKNRDMSDIEKLEKASSVLGPHDLIGNLSVWKDVFVNIRYIHEPSGKQHPWYSSRNREFRACSYSPAETGMEAFRFVHLAENITTKGCKE